MNNNQSNNKRIAKNTAMLYFRMLLIMGVTLYTTRIVLRILGVEDFGIYNVVGGVITMASFLSASMSSAIQRFISFELGQNNLLQLNRVFGMSINIHILISFVVLIIAETLGLWFINTQLTIPTERLIAANWVYQFSVLAFIVNIISVPYNAVILAYEKMSIFAYIGILEVVLKLTAAFALNWFGFDKLALYAIFIFIISLIVRIFYGIYVEQNIQDCTYSFFWDKKLFNTLLNFAGWNLWGNIAFVTYNQGINILLNIFFGPAINAARAIAYQVNSALNSFVANFQVALKPQIIKSYATGDNGYMQALIFSGAKYSFFLMMLLCAPIILSTSQILDLWLDTVPAYTVVFCRLVLIETIINSISGTLMSGAQASGKIKLYQGLVGGLLMLILPISYAFLYFGYPPETTLYISISFAILALIFRVYIVSSLLIFSKMAFLKKVLFPATIITVLITLTGLGLAQYSEMNITSFIVTNLVLIITIVTSIVFIGLEKKERVFLRMKFLEIKNK
ncbi:lipopolysaccharide biosynthesis protein [Arenibacter algicola]|uniref:lipopolysaccharide biosynthesis protein n=1 Tax=Arenibacter algicola TaxID=616991 RepID=UPI001C0782A8|nr:lipopolysaccharide biosynthesis protein [Arenibacter algicola]MBU2907268.1 lipopolysaccharide biosynthesis protein [Arenibacter algicola]